MQWDKQAWCPVREWQLANMNVDKNMSAVLTVTASLTRFLERRFQMSLTVHLHEQFLDKATPAEAGLLGCACGAPSLRRQVSLLHRGAVMFDAESVLPLEGLPKALMDELQAGKRPLANLLLDQGLSLARSDLSVVQVASGVCAGRWARRSVLRSASGTQALVVEVFHNEFWSRVQRLTGQK